VKTRRKKLWKSIRTILKSQRGEGTIEAAVVVVVAVMMLGLAMKLFPIFMMKSQLNTFAVELSRTAAITGQIGAEVTAREENLRRETGLDPVITWSAAYLASTSRVQLDEPITLELEQNQDLGLFGGFSSFPITLRSKASSRSEVFWK
jgi:Flp pilus assembly protein TadG